jgi:hypothetical protein
MVVRSLERQVVTVLDTPRSTIPAAHSPHFFDPSWTATSLLRGMQPPGSRVSDLIDAAVRVLKLYRPDLLSQSDYTQIGLDPDEEN